jgi:hypothetical protein
MTCMPPLLALIYRATFQPLFSISHSLRAENAGTSRSDRLMTQGCIEDRSSCGISISLLALMTTTLVGVSSARHHFAYQKI